MSVPVPTIEEADLSSFMSSGRRADEVLAERQNLKQIIEESEAKIKELDNELGNALDLRNLKSVIWEDYLLIRRGPSRPRPILDTVMLLDAGVTPQQIQAGTRFGAPGKPGVTVRALSEVKAYENAAERSSTSPEV